VHCGAVNWIYRSITGLVLISREPGARKCGGFRSRQSEGDSESWPGAFSLAVSRLSRFADLLITEYSKVLTPEELRDFLGQQPSE
jgi:hypothetical protein